MRPLPGHSQMVEAVAFSPAGGLLASGGEDGTIRLWEVPSGTPRGKPVHQTAMIGALAFSPDGKRLCHGDHDGFIAVHDLEHGGIRNEWADQGRVTGIAYASRRDRLAWCSYDGVWLREGESTPVLLEPLSAPNQYLFSLAMHPDGDALVVAGLGSEATWWDLGRQLPRRLPHRGRGCWRVAFSPDGSLLALGLASGLQLWDAEAGRLLLDRRDHTDVVSGVAFSPDGRRVLTGSWDRTVRLYEVVAPDNLLLLDTYDWNIGGLHDVAISPDGSLAAAGGRESDYLVIWDLE